MSSGRPSSRRTARGTAANASLISTRSTSRRFQPARSSACRTAGTGPIPNMPGSTAATPYATRRAMGCRRLRSANSRSATTIAAAPLLRPGALPAVIVPSLRNAGFSLVSTSSVVSGRFASSVAKVSGPLRPLISTPTICVAKRPAACAAANRFCERSAPPVLVLARNLLASDQILGVPSRMLARESVVETIAQHAVVDFGITHPLSPAPAGNEVGRLIHVLHAAGDGGFGVAEPDLLCRRGDRLRARAADTIDCHRRHGDGHTAVDRGLPRRVHAVAGLDDVTHHDAADARRLEPRAPQRFANGGGAQFGGRRTFQ